MRSALGMLSDSAHSEAIRSHPKPPEATRSHPKPPEATRSHQKPPTHSEAIRSHPKQSEAIRRHLAGDEHGDADGADEDALPLAAAPGATPRARVQALLERAEADERDEPRAQPVVPEEACAQRSACNHQRPRGSSLPYPWGMFAADSSVAASIFVMETEIQRMHLARHVHREAIRW